MRPGPRPEWTKAEHTFAGKAYIVLSYIGAGLAFLGALFVMLLPAELIGDEMAGLRAFLVVFLIGIAALTAAVARGVARFATWAWWVTMVFLVLGVLGALVSLIDPSETPAGRVGSLVSLLLDGIWIHYFWNRRADF